MKGAEAGLGGEYFQAGWRLGLLDVSAGVGDQLRVVGGDLRAVASRAFARTVASGFGLGRCVEEFNVLRARQARDPKRWRLGGRYGLGALALAILALFMGGGWLWILWPAVDRKSVV